MQANMTYTYMRDANMPHIYKSFEYIPDILEDEDTRKYIHDVYLNGKCIGQINKTHWYKVSFDEFKEFVDNYIKEQNGNS